MSMNHQVLDSRTTPKAQIQEQWKQSPLLFILKLKPCYWPPYADCSMSQEWWGRGTDMERARRLRPENIKFVWNIMWNMFETEVCCCRRVGLEQHQIRICHLTCALITSRNVECGGGRFQLPRTRSAGTMQMSLGPAFLDGLQAFQGQDSALEPRGSCVIDLFEYARCVIIDDDSWTCIDEPHY